MLAIKFQILGLIIRIQLMYSIIAYITSIIKCFACASDHLSYRNYYYTQLFIDNYQVIYWTQNFKRKAANFGYDFASWLAA